MDETPPTLAALQTEVAHLRQQNQELQAIYTTSLELMKGLDLARILQSILQRACELGGTEHGYVCLVEPDNQSITFRETTGIFSVFAGAQMHQGEGLTGRVWQMRQPLLVNDYDTWEYHSQPFVSRGICAIVGVPLLVADEVIGVLGMAHNERGRTFARNAVRLLERFAPLATVAIQNARLYSAVQHELAERTRAEAIIQSQAEALIQLSTPLMPITKQTVAMPLVGHIDEQRAAQMLEVLLQGVSRQRAHLAILDITGVQEMDTQVATILIQSAQAAALLGSQVVITGIRPDIAQTLVSLGVAFENIRTFGTFQEGIAYALRRQQARVGKLPVSGG